MKKRIFITILTFCIIIGMTISVNASSFTTSLTADKTTAKPGDEIQVSVNLSNLDVGENGINAFGATLEYDKNVFETVSSSDITAQNGWDSPTYNSDNGKILTTNGTFIKTNSSIMKIKFKVKSGIANTTSQIKLTSIGASNGDEDIEAADTSLTITISNTTGNTTGNTTSNTTSNTTGNKDIPSTGSNTVYSFFGLGLFTILAVYSYFKIMKFRGI